MTRGRKKDPTIPPTRALIQQRDYRARRAHYVASLEERCQRVEEDNARLREEIAAIKASNGIVPSIPQNPETAAATIHLMHQLSLTAASLTRFQQVAFPEHVSRVVPSTASTEDITNHTSQSSPSLSSVPFTRAISPTVIPPTSSQSKATNEDPPSTFSQSGDVVDGISRSVSPDSECCGGILDCRHLIEPEPTSSLTRTSGLRSTSSPGFGYSNKPYR